MVESRTQYDMSVDTEAIYLHNGTYRGTKDLLGQQFSKERQIFTSMTYKQDTGQVNHLNGHEKMPVAISSSDEQLLMTSPQETSRDDMDNEDEEDEDEYPSDRLQPLRPTPVHFVTRFGEAQRWISASPDNGYIRVYNPANPKASHISSCTTQTSTYQICAQLGLISDTLYVQFCGDRIHRLEPSDQPLQIQVDFLHSIGYTDSHRRQKMGTSCELGYLIRFLCGIPIYDSTFSPRNKRALLFVKRTRGISVWKQRHCVISGTRLILYKANQHLKMPTILYLPKGDVNIDKSRDHCLKVTSYLQDGKSYLLAMRNAADFERWHRYLKSATTKLDDSADLSNSNLEIIPKPLFALSDLTTLNLKHNILRVRTSDAPPTSIGWINDLSRFQTLSNLNLSDNNLGHFPESLCRLITLRVLNVTSNKILFIPPEIGKLRRLETLHLDNNLLWQLPDEINELIDLDHLGLDFNQFSNIPEVAGQTIGGSWPSLHLAGNQISAVSESDLQGMRTIRRMDLRLNSLSLPPEQTRLFSLFTSLTHLDLRNNSISCLNVINVKTLEFLDCSHNQISEVSVNGSCIKTFRATHNYLTRFLIEPKPEWLEEVDISFNQLVELPSYFSYCFLLKKITVSHNRLIKLPKDLFTEASSKLKILRANHNLITHFPEKINNVPLEELYLHSNRLRQIQPDFLSLASRLRILNLSQNCLTQLPPVDPLMEDRHRVQELYLSFNKLQDTCIPIIVSYKRLRVLHIAYNCLTNLKSELIGSMESLQEINISGNELKKLPESLMRLPYLLVLRAHCNKLVRVPDCLDGTKLKILDLGSNYLPGPCFSKIMNSQLSLLDISGNLNPSVSIQDFGEIKNKRRVYLVDMTGEQREIPGTTMSLSHATRSPPPLHLMSGLAETAGNRNKLCITVLKKVHFPTPNSAVFAMFDGGYNTQLPRHLQITFPQAIMEELKRSQDPKQVLKYTFLSLHKSLRTVGQKLGASMNVVCVKQCSPHMNSSESPVPSSVESGRDNKDGDAWELSLGNVGDISSVIWRAREKRVERLAGLRFIGEDEEERERVKHAGGVITEDNKINGVTRCSRLIGSAYLYPSVLPDPWVTTTTATKDDLLIQASHGLWDVIDPEEAMGEIINCENPVAAAKKLMDLAQAFGCNENLSILVLRFDDFISEPFPSTVNMDFVDRDRNDSSCSSSTSTLVPASGSHGHHYGSQGIVDDGDTSTTVSKDGSSIFGVHPGGLKGARWPISTPQERNELPTMPAISVSMSTIHSMDSMNEQNRANRMYESSPKALVHKSSTLSSGKSPRTHRYTKRHDALRVMEQQMTQRLSNEEDGYFGDENEVKRKEFEAAFGEASMDSMDTSSISGGEGEDFTILSGTFVARMTPTDSLERNNSHLDSLDYNSQRTTNKVDSNWTTSPISKAIQPIVPSSSFQKKSASQVKKNVSIFENRDAQMKFSELQGAVAAPMVQAGSITGRQKLALLKDDTSISNKNFFRNYTPRTERFQPPNSQAERSVRLPLTVSPPPTMTVDPSFESNSYSNPLHATGDTVSVASSSLIDSMDYNPYDFNPNDPKLMLMDRIGDAAQDPPSEYTSDIDDDYLSAAAKPKAHDRRRPTGVTTTLYRKRGEEYPSHVVHNYNFPPSNLLTYEATQITKSSTPRPLIGNISEAKLVTYEHHPIGQKVFSQEKIANDQVIIQPKPQLYHENVENKPTHSDQLNTNKIKSSETALEHVPSSLTKNENTKKKKLTWFTWNSKNKRKPSPIPFELQNDNKLEGPGPGTKFGNSDTTSPPIIDPSFRTVTEVKYSPSPIRVQHSKTAPTIQLESVDNFPNASLQNNVHGMNSNFRSPQLTTPVSFTGDIKSESSNLSLFSNEEVQSSLFPDHPMYLHTSLSTRESPAADYQPSGQSKRSQAVTFLSPPVLHANDRDNIYSSLDHPGITRNVQSSNPKGVYPSEHSSIPTALRVPPPPQSSYQHHHYARINKRPSSLNTSKFEITRL